MLYVVSCQHDTLISAPRLCAVKPLAPGCIGAPTMSSGLPHGSKGRSLLTVQPAAVVPLSCSTAAKTRSKGETHRPAETLVRSCSLPSSLPACVSGGLGSGPNPGLVYDVASLPAHLSSGRRSGGDSATGASSDKPPTPPCPCISSFCCVFRRFAHGSLCWLDVVGSLRQCLRPLMGRDDCVGLKSFALRLLLDPLNGGELASVKETGDGWHKRLCPESGPWRGSNSSQARLLLEVPAAASGRPVVVLWMRQATSFLDRHTDSKAWKSWSWSRRCTSNASQIVV